MIKRKIIYSRETNVKDCFLLGKHYSSTVYTSVIEYTFLGIFHFYKVKQCVPYIKNPLYDGEYATNKALTIIANRDKYIAKQSY